MGARLAAARVSRGSERRERVRIAPFGISHGNAVVLAAFVLAASAVPGHAQYSSDNQGPLVLRPPPGLSDPAGQVPGVGGISAGGNVIVNLDAIRGTGAGRAYTPGYTTGRPVGSASPYLNRPPLPGEVPLVDEDPVLRRPPQAAGTAGPPAIERRELPPVAATRPAQPQPTTRAQPPTPAQPRPQTVAPAPATRPDPPAAAAAEPTPRPTARPAEVASQPAPTGDTAPGGDPATTTAAATTAPARPTAGAAPSDPAIPPPPTQTPAATASTTAPAPAPAEPTPPAQPQATPQQTAPQQTAPQPTTTTAPPQQVAAAPAPERTLPAVPRDQGQDLVIPFSGESITLDGNAEQQLAALAGRLKEGSERLQIKAYAQAPDNGSSSSARRLSLSRALAVRSYLIDQGIRSTRIDVRALGDTGEGQLDRVDISLSDRQ